MENQIECLEGEIWKDAIGYEGLYKISNFGRVLSVARAIKKGLVIDFVADRLKLLNVGSHGYWATMLYANNKGKSTLIHRVLALAFIPNPDNKKCVNHIDGNKLNNTLENLEWCTHKENCIHASKTGLTKSGDKSVHSKISNQQAIEVMQKHKQTGFSFCKLHQVYFPHISKGIIKGIVSGRNWKRVTVHIRSHNLEEEFL